MQYNGYRDLKVYKLAYKLAMDIFEITKTFPKEEKYSLVDQIRRSSRSVPANIAEAWRRRIYTKMFITRIIDAFSEAGETEVWLDFSKDSDYINDEKHSKFICKYTEVNKMLQGMLKKPESFCRDRK
ncbi:MAG: four helix bundle protein [Candidatus Aureabacteria bacterium]|nr:four helix bundle protein [Candidatus Auribacterota bacterium]